MKSLIFDIEGNSLNPSKLWVMAGKTDGPIRHTTSYDGMRKQLTNADVLIGHNIMLFDIPVLERILDIKVEAKIVDTLALSWYLFPDRNRHGLEEWGEELGVKKPSIIEWDNENLLDEYINRCKEDVRINSLLWNKIWDKLIRMYGTKEEAWRLIDYLMFKMDCVREQERSRWKLDVDLCKKSLDELVPKLEEAYEELKKAMPPVPIKKKKNRPAKCYKRDGSISSTGASWLALLRQEGYDIAEDRIHADGPDTVEYVDGYAEPKPSSSEQVKNWLLEYGWKPEVFKYKRLEDGSIKAIPQVNKEHSQGICESVKKLYDKNPSFELLEGLSIIKHRISILEGFLKDASEDGYLKAQVAGLTNTLRFKHRTIVNLPKVGKPYGDIIRGVLVAPEGYELCGSDLSSLEDRLKQHYIYPYDPEYVKEMLDDKYDPHLSLALSAGAITKQQMDDYVNDVDKSIKPIRDIFKNANYACQYQAGASRIAITAQISEKEAKKVHTAYWEKNWAIKKVAQDQVVKKIGDEMWLLNPISKFYYSLRNEKDIFSTLVQGSGVYVFDMWIKEFRDVRPQMTGQFHDEVILTVKKGAREKCEKLLRDSIKRVNDKFKLNRSLDIDVAFGSTYAEVH